MGTSQKEELLNSMELISGYISNELNSGKSKEEVVKSLTNKMNITKEVAINLVYKNDNFINNMKYFKTSYTRKNLLIYILSSFVIYYFIFSLFSFFNDYNVYVITSKYLGVIFGVFFILFAFTMNESKNLIYKYYCISITTIFSLCSFLLGCLFLNYIEWDETNTLENDGALILKFITNIINFFIELGPQIVGSIFLVISLILVCISWVFYYEITIEKLKH